MYASLVLVAMTGTPVEGDTLSGSSPTWYGDYVIARKQGVETKKPLAVFIGSGEAGYGQVSHKGKLSKEVLRLLKDGYVCVYLDTKTASGKQLARTFRVKDHGLVIGDQAGESQAFRHRGELSSRDLKRYLKKYSVRDRIVRRTEYHVPPVVRVAAVTLPAPAMSGGGSC